MLDDAVAQVRPGPPKPSRFTRPAVFSMPLGTERYVVEGCGAILVRVEAGDKLRIENTEGGQPCEVVCAGPDGKADAALLNTAAQGPAKGLMALLTCDDQSLRGLRMGLDARGIDLATSTALHLFDSGTPAGTDQEFTATRDGVVIVAAPHPNGSGAMDIEAQDTASPLTLWITRAVIKQVPRFELPDPLADPVADIRVASATADAFFVKAGDYIQIIDVDGRQCTDFECFSACLLYTSPSPRD